jgi:hypothetical protein
MLVFLTDIFWNSNSKHTHSQSFFLFLKTQKTKIQIPNVKIKEIIIKMNTDVKLTAQTEKPNHYM